MKYRILYIEDEHILGKLVTESLAGQGYQVLQVTNGSDALHHYRQFSPHLCLLDVMLPGKDGYEVATQIRAIDAGIPVIFLTARIQTADLVMGFHTGCNDYIRKPFSMEELLLRINRWLTEKYGQPEVLSADHYVLDGFMFFPHKQLLSGAGTTIRLTHKEAAILNILYQQRNNIVSRDYLLQKIWGTGSIYNSRSLDVYVTRLRKYFNGTQNQIITLKGIGYRFICG